MATIPTTNLWAQNFRYGVTPFRPELVNPAYRFENKLVDVTAIYALPYSSDLDNTNIHLNANYQFKDNMGIGIKGNYSTPSDIRTEITAGAFYNYKFKFGEKMDLGVGVGFGAFMTNYDKSIKEVESTTDGYAEIGIAYRWTNLYVGASSTIAIQHTTTYEIAANARYDFKLCENFTLSPIVGYTYYSDYQGLNDLGGVVDGGLMFGFNKWAQIGVAYNSNNIVNAFASVWASDYVRIFYNGGIAVDDVQSDIAPIRNEIGVRFMLGRK